MYMYGFSTREQGDMRRDTKREAFLKFLSLDAASLVLAQQIHGDRIAVVTRKETGRQIPDVDGLVSADQHVILGVRVADCVPLLFVDPKTRIIGAAHAGWRGTVSGIAKGIIHTMKSLGAQPKNIVAFIGPHIGMCCYDVSGERAQLFLKTLHNDPKVASLIEGTWHLDLGYANFLTLIDGGILSSHIDGPPTCTSCQVDTFFSYRKDNKKTFGEQMGVIGWKT